MTTGLVLVTGSSGRIGRAAVQELQARGHRVRGFDLTPTPGLPDMVVGSLTNVADVRRAVQGVASLIHMAATPDDAENNFLSEIVPNNIVGVYYVLEEAQKAGVQRLVLASSGQVTWFQRFRGPLPLGVDVQPTPRYWYACSKVFLEAAGRSFAEQFGQTVIIVRLGWCPRTKEQVEEITASDWAKDVYLSPGDAGRFCAAAVEAPLASSYAVVNVTSKPVEKMYADLEPAKRLVGWEPRESWPQGVEIVVGPAGR